MGCEIPRAQQVVSVCSLVHFGMVCAWQPQLFWDVYVACGAAWCVQGWAIDSEITEWRNWPATAETLVVLVKLVRVLSGGSQEVAKKLVVSWALHLHCLGPGEVHVMGHLFVL